MARTTMRRVSPLVLVLLSALPWHPPTAAAQELPAVRLRLLSQTPWNSSFDLEHGRELELRFRAENVGTEPIGDLAVGVTLYSRVLSRSAFEASLATDPPVVIDAETLAREDALDPGVTRDFEISFTLDSPGIDAEQSGVYPLKVDLRSGVTSLAELRTAVIFLVRPPELPLALSWTFVLHHPITFGPDDTFTDRSLEAALGPGGRLNGQIRALLELAKVGTPVDVAVAPVLLTQLGRMRAGFVVSEGGARRQVAEGEAGAALADGAIHDLRTIAAAPSILINALPFSAPELPALYGGGLDRDVPIQLERGRSITSSVLATTTLGEVLRPPGAALDEETVRGLSTSGIRTLIVGPATVALPEQPLGFSGPATALLNEATVTAIVPEPGTEALLRSTIGQDPVLAAQVLLGELATIWQERPGEERGVALVLSEDVTFPGPFFVPLARGVSIAPWLEPVGASEFVLRFRPTERTFLTQPSLRRFPASYVASLKQARRRIDTLRSMLPPESKEPERLDTMLLLAEARQFLSDTGAGLEFVTSVRDSVRDTVDDLALDVVAAVTLTADAGGIPVTVSNTGTFPLRLSVRLISQHLRTVPSQELQLEPGRSETFRLQAELRSTGRFPVAVQMVAPNGRPIGEETIVVRSTAYNGIALLITIGAAVVLLLLWARRFIPRRSP